LKLISLLAQGLTTTGPVSPSPDAPWWARLFGNNMFPLLIAAAFLIMIMTRKKGGGDKQRLEALKQMKKGDRIQTIGGILGTVLRTEENRIEVKVDETNNTKMWFTRTAIHRIIEDDKAEVK
jgi:preprotein translocase subunit YajC